jgi:DNA repair protein RadC
MTIIQTLFGPEEISKPRKTIRLRVIKAVYERQIVREDAPDYLVETRFTSPQQVFELFKDLRVETKEHVICLHLDGKNRIICLDRVSIGSLNQSIVCPREVLKTAVMSSAAALILVHNHPSGDPGPSREDIEVTRRLKEASEILGIRLLDHIIVGDSYVSLTEAGNL